MLTPKVSVSLITYNHAPFLEQAVESVLAQKTSFPFELIIGEDASTDGTRKIVQRFAAQHPELIRAHFHERSQNIGYEGQPTGRFNLVHNLRSARGQYVAMLDGDDFWTDPTKLQRQVDFLEAHPECSTCFHRVDFVDEAGEPLPTPPQVTVVKPMYTLDEMLRGDFFTRTASVMYRRGLFEDFPEWYFRSPVGDFPLHVMNGLRGDFGFLDRTMAMYRVHAGGRWSATTRTNSPAEERAAEQRRLHQLTRTAHLYEILLPVLGQEHAQVARGALARYRYLRASMLRRLGSSGELRAAAWQLLRSGPRPAEISFLDAFLFWLEGCLPWLRRFTSAAHGMLARRRSSP